MIVKTRIFEFCNGQYKNLAELAQAMEISVSQIYRVREGKRRINQKFIVGAIRAFPNRRFDELFYFASELPIGDNNQPHQSLIVRSSDKPATDERHILKNLREALAKFVSAVEEYSQRLESNTNNHPIPNKISQTKRK